MKHSSLILSILLLSFGCNAMAKPKAAKASRPAKQQVTQLASDAPTDASNYADSLAIYKAQLDSVMAVKDSLQQVSGNSLRYYKLFTPLAYYPSIINNKMMDSNDVEGDDALLDSEIESAITNIYFQRPELVETTVKRLHSSAARADEQPKKPVRRKVEIQKEEMKVEEEAPVDGPVEVFVYKPNFWKFSGDYSLQFMQSHLSENWYQSGESNLSMLGAATLQANYNNKQKIKWDNKLEMKLGFQTSESDEVHKFKSSSDLLRYTGKLGVQATKKWYYTLQAIATTQFTHGYKSNDEKVYSDFMSPLTVNLSLGMDYNVSAWNNKLTGSCHIAPFAYNWKYVSRLDLATRYGIDEGNHSLQDYGSQFTINLQWKPTNNIKWTSRLYGYTTYKRAEIEWENTISMAVSKYVTTNVFLYPRFDDGVKKANSETYWQFKEYFSLGFAYSM